MKNKGGRPSSSTALTVLLQPAICLMLRAVCGVEVTIKRLTWFVLIVSSAVVLSVMTIQPAFVSQRPGTVSILHRRQLAAPTLHSRPVSGRLAVLLLPVLTDDFLPQLISDYFNHVAAVDCRVLPNVTEFSLHLFYYNETLRAIIEHQVTNLMTSQCPQLSSGGATQPTFIKLYLHQTTIANALRKVNDVTSDAYIDDVDYFRLVFLRPNASTSGLLPTADVAVAFDKLVPRHHGLIAETEIVNNVTSLSSVLVGSAHFEVFGMFVPVTMSNVVDATQLTCNVYSHKDMTQYIVTGSDVISRPTNTTHASFSELFEDMKHTLDRFMSAFSASKCWRCLPAVDTDTKVISMSLYGASPRYTHGALRNAQLLPVNYPGWRLWFFIEANSSKPKFGQVPDRIKRKIVQLGAELRPVDATKLAPMLWRFQVAVDNNVSVFIVRDSDSRLTPRDSAVVADWLKHPDAAFHCIRDHPSHSGYAISGGLWGGRTKLLANVFQGGLFDGMKRYGAGYIEDMNFLCRDVWPKVQNVSYCHDSFSCDKYPSSHAFPVPRIGSEHLGQVYNEYSVGRQGDINILMGAGVNKKCVP